MKEYLITSLAETAELAEQLAEKIADKQVCILLKGDLGAGKTTFTKALGKALGVKKVINSPTFTILKSYKMKDQRMLYHIDAYRLEGITQDLGLFCFPGQHLAKSDRKTPKSAAPYGRGYKPLRNICSRHCHHGRT